MFSHIVANTCPRLPSRFETSNRFSVDIRPDFPVPYFTKKLQLQIRQCPLALLTTFFGVKTRSSDPSMKSHKDLDEIPGKLPRASFCHVCLYFSRSLLASYLTPEAWRVVNKLSHFEGPELKFNDSRAGSRFLTAGSLRSPSLRSPKLAPSALSKKIIHVAPPNREPARRLASTRSLCPQVIPVECKQGRSSKKVMCDLVAMKLQKLKCCLTNIQTRSILIKYLATLQSTSCRKYEKNSLDI